MYTEVSEVGTCLQHRTNALGVPVPFCSLRTAILSQIVHYQLCSLLLVCTSVVPGPSINPSSFTAVDSYCHRHNGIKASAAFAQLIKSIRGCPKKDACTFERYRHIYSYIHLSIYSKSRVFETFEPQGLGMLTTQPLRTTTNDAPGAAALAIVDVQPLRSLQPPCNCSRPLGGISRKLCIHLYIYIHRCIAASQPG